MKIYNYFDKKLIKVNLLLEFTCDDINYQVVKVNKNEYSVTYGVFELQRFSDKQFNLTPDNVKSVFIQKYISNKMTFEKVLYFVETLKRQIEEKNNKKYSV